MYISTIPINKNIINKGSIVPKTFGGILNEYCLFLIKVLYLCLSKCKLYQYCYINFIHEPQIKILLINLSPFLFSDISHSTKMSDTMGVDEIVYKNVSAETTAVATDSILETIEVNNDSEKQEELEKLKYIHEEQKKMNSGSLSDLPMSMEEKIQMDNRSIYVGNVDYGATPEELEQHFFGCGMISRVTIFNNKFTGQPKGYAYIEFTQEESVQIAMAMDKSLFRNREIKVNQKRTNRPGMSMTNRPPRARGYRGYRGYRGASGSRRSSGYVNPVSGYRGRSYYGPY